MGALCVATACGDAEDGPADTDAAASAGAEAVELEFDASAPLLPDFDLDTGWQPASGPAGIRLTFDAAGTIEVAGRGVAQDGRVEGTAGSGSLSIDAAIGMELSARLDTLGLEWEGVVERFEYALPAATETFDPFSLADPLTTTTALPPAELGTVPIPSVPGASVQLDVTGGTFTTTFETTCASSDGAHAQVLGEVSVEGSLDLAATILVEIPVVGTESFGPFEVTAPLPALPRTLDLGTRDIFTAESVADQGVCDAAPDTDTDTDGGTGGTGDAGSTTVGPTTDPLGDSSTGDETSGETSDDTTGSVARKPTLYLNFDGAVLSNGFDDAPSDITQVPELATTLAPFPDAALRQEVVSLVEEQWSAFDVTITDQRPAAGPYSMVLITPTNPFEGAGGIAAVDCGNENNNNVAAVFYLEGMDSYELGTMASWVLGATLGLENVEADSGDIMAGGGSFRDTCFQFAAEPMCEQSAACGHDQQNSVAQLHAVFDSW